MKPTSKAAIERMLAPAGYSIKKLAGEIKGCREVLLNNPAFLSSRWRVARALKMRVPEATYRDLLARLGWNRFRCLPVQGGCGKIFEVEAPNKRHTKCRECQLAAIAGKKKASRARQKQGMVQGKIFRGREAAKIFKSTHAEVAAALGLSKTKVQQLELQALTKIRTNPELKNIWAMLAGEAASAPELGIFSEEDPASLGDRLLEYQIAVADWWAVHDEIVELADGKMDCSRELGECLAEIGRYQGKIEEALKQI